MSQSLFGSLTTHDFLNQHWQQKPLLVRQAVDTDVIDIDPAELAGLCCDTEAPSRIVIEHGETPWQMKIGPFEEQDFTSLPADHWSLLINDIETYIPELQAFIEPFRFLPDWRIDDLMISFATDKGSVGPHVDDYDVFLIQLEGTRRWSINESPDFDSTLLVGPDLKILQNFVPNQTWDLEPGDMLYLPPGMPHHGVAVGDCMTLSVGFRAPSSGELIQSWLDDIGDQPNFKTRFNDAKRQAQQDSGEITQQDLKSLKALLLKGINDHASTLDLWLGKYLSEGKRPDPALVEAYTVENDGGELRFEAQTDYQRFPGTRMAYIFGEQELTLFVGGEQFSLDHKHLDAVRYLCSEQEYLAAAIASNCSDPTILELLNTLINNNKFVLMEHDPCDQNNGDFPYS